MVNKTDSNAFEFSQEKQELFLKMMLSDPVLYTRVSNIMNPANFEKALRPVAVLYKDHTEKYKMMPDSDQILAETGIKLEPYATLTDSQIDWFLDNFEAFTKRQEIERAILASVKLLDDGDFGPIEKLVKDAIQISLQKDMGTDYFANPAERINKYFNSGGQVSTGWPQMDKVLYGGMSRGELNIFAGGSGSGKSLVMMNLALNWLSVGMSGVYISLELSEELTSIRTDAMLTNTSTRDIRKDIENTHLKVRMMSKHAGKYRVKALPAQSNVNDIRAYLKEVQIQTGIKVDFVMVDYLDLVMPASVKVNPNDQFIKDKYVAEELRNLAQNLNILLVTASQLNRTAVDEIEFDHSHIAGGISKINTADNVFGIFTSRHMREKGKYQIQCMKSRNSTGVGQKIDLDYSVETMRISDSGGEDGDSGNRYRPQPSATDIMNKLKPSVNITTNDNVQEAVQAAPKHIVADVRGSQLKSLLNNLKK